MVMMFHSSVPNDRGAIHKHGARAAADDIYSWSRRLGFGMIVASHDPKDQSGSHIKVRALAKGGWSVPCVSIQLTLSQRALYIIKMMQAHLHPSSRGASQARLDASSPALWGNAMA